MSQLLIHDYLKQLDLIKKFSGSNRETIVREAFKDLLKATGKQQGLVFLAEYPLKTATKSNIMVDGALLHELRMPLGYWEAKDDSDNLEEEISKKLKKGYPQDNIIFSDDVTAVLWQNRYEVLRCDMTDTHALAKLLKLFFSFERPEIAGFRAAVEQFKTYLPAVLQALREMIEREHTSNVNFRKAEQKFLTHAQEVINPSLTAADIREMLIQHILTEEIFAKVFDDSNFHQHNNVARELYELESEFFTGSLKKQTLKVIYENFYKVYNAKAADRLGVVYTPNEIVRFMIAGADWLTEKHFGKNLIDKDVEILDPATGTGTFTCELLEHFRGQPARLKHKYLNELHANEVAILPYYVANLNIEATYAAISGQYEEFPNLCFVDTLDNVGLHTAATGTTADIFGSVSEENVARIKRQNSKRIMGGDVRANPRLSGTKHNVFGIQTGVAISFFVKKSHPLSHSRERVARIYYIRRPEMETAEEKLSFLANHPMSGLSFDKVKHYSEKMLNHRLTDNHYQTFGDELQLKNSLICIDPGSSKSFSSLAANIMPDLHLNGDTQFVPQFIYRDGVELDNITDWALKQFRQHYAQPSQCGSGTQASRLHADGTSALPITKEAIFHYCYAVLHNPLYREKYALNLKREFPRIPFYQDFWQWAAWGEALMELHIGYETVEPFKLQRTDIPDERVRAAGMSPKTILRADKDASSITLDTETTLRGIPPAAWDYKLGNRCALEWVLDQYKKKKPKDPTIREKFDTYRLKDYKEKVIELLMRVTTVSVETERITQAMKVGR